MAQPRSTAGAAADLPATKARQGRLGRDVFWVLVISMVLAVVAVTLAWVYRAPQLAASEANNGKQAAAARAFDAPPSQPIQSATPPSQ
jgi:energy-coupling factor transporter transmembrane protein EcfT